MLRSGSSRPASCDWGNSHDRACLATRSLYLSRLRGRSACASSAQVGRGSFGVSPEGGLIPIPPPAELGCSQVRPIMDWPTSETSDLGAGEGRARGHARELHPMTALSALLLRDMRLAVRVGGGALMGVLFFLLVVTMVPFGVGPDLKLLATLLGLDRLLAADHDDGSLDLILMSHAPLELAVATKAIAHWLTTGLPLVIAAPLLGIFLNLDAWAIGIVALTLLVGTPALTFIGLIGAALAVALERGGLLLPVLVLPLTVPVLIFGISASDAAILHAAPFGAAFLILIALTLISVVVGPFAAAAVLRHGLD